MLAPHPHLVIAAHLDTVFPEGTDVKVKREGAVLHGPGIGDDCRGLAVLVSIVRAMKQANVQTPGSITFVANVGEEGLGDLRGMKQLFNETLKGQIDRFVSIDGTGLHVTTRRGRQPSLPRDVQGPGRSQLRRLRPRQPDRRDGPRDREDPGAPGAEAAEDDVQRRPRSAAARR